MRLRLRKLRQPEVQNLQSSIFGDEQVLWLQVTMDNAFLMRGGQSAGDLHSVIDRLANGKRSTLDLLAQCFSIEQLGNQIRRAFIGAHLENRKNIGMIQRRGGARLLLEAPQPLGIAGEGRRQNLDRDI